MASMQDLPEDDEFHGISFCQVDGDEVNEVKVVTYALMSWLKGQGEPDTIDISNESNHAQLELSLDLALADDEIDASATVFMNAYESSAVLSYCAYPAALSGLSKQQLDHIQQTLSQINGDIPFGSFEIFFYQNDLMNGEGGAVRFKAAVCMYGVLRGKVAMVDSLFSESSASIVYGMNELINFLHG